MNNPIAPLRSLSGLALKRICVLVASPVGHRGRFPNYATYYAQMAKPEETQSNKVSGANIQLTLLYIQCFEVPQHKVLSTYIFGD